MIKKFSNRKKIISLVLLFVVLIFIAKNRSYDLTVNSYEKMKNLQKKYEEIKKENLKPIVLRSKLDYYDELIGNTELSPSEIQHNIFTFITNYEGIELKKLHEIHFFNNEGHKIVTNQILIEGNFNKLLKVVYDFEKKNKTSRLVSIYFFKEEKSKQLKMNLFFQNYLNEIGDNL